MGYLAISQEHEQIIKEKDVILQNLQTTESQLKSQLSELETGLETQRAKNNEQKQELESVLKESEESQKQFLQRLFPDIQAATNNSHGEWLNQFEQEVIKFKETKQEIPTPVEKIVEIEKIVEKIVEVPAPAPAATEKIVEKIVENC